MRRIVLWALTTVSTVVLLFGYHTSTSGVGPKAPSSFVSGSVAGGTSASGSSSGPSGSGSSSGSSGSGSSSGSSGGSAVSRSTVTGGVANTQWGPVQVKLTLHGATISAVDVVQYPNGNGTDAQINSYALPILIQETTDAQSAQIDMVSGATVTSTGYIESLQSAIDQAGL